jgi:hypothetical protein
VLGHRVEPGLPEVDEVEVVTPERPQVGLDERAQLLGRGQPVVRGADLGRDDQLVRVRRERFADQLVGDPQGREGARPLLGVRDAGIEGRGVEVVDVEVRAPPHRRLPVPCGGPVAHEPLGAEADPMDVPVAEPPERHGFDPGSRSGTGFRGGEGG